MMILSHRLPSSILIFLLALIVRYPTAVKRLLMKAFQAFLESGKRRVTQPIVRLMMWLSAVLMAKSDGQVFPNVEKYLKCFDLLYGELITHKRKGTRAETL